jgi:hypothetical protein
MSSYGAKGTRTPNNRLQRTVRYAARRTGAMGYVPDLHKIWVGTSDQQLMALSNEFPGFYRYALIMEEASEAERNKASRPYDGMAGFFEEHKQRAAQLLVTAANLEVSPTKVRKVPQDSCQLPGRKGFSAIPELPRRDLV